MLCNVLCVYAQVGLATFRGPLLFPSYCNDFLGDKQQHSTRTPQRTLNKCVVPDTHPVSMVSIQWPESGTDRCKATDTSPPTSIRLFIASTVPSCMPVNAGDSPCSSAGNWTPFRLKCYRSYRRRCRRWGLRAILRCCDASSWQTLELARTWPAHELEPPSLPGPNTVRQANAGVTSWRCAWPRYIPLEKITQIVVIVIIL